MGRFIRSALQTLHKVSAKARDHNYFLGGVTHEWVSYYEQRIQSERSYLNEWHAMDSLESRRPPSPDSLRTKPSEREATLALVRSSLKEIMMSVDLDEVTSKQVRVRLEEMLDTDLAEYKSFIDEEMLVILGQMDAATEIFPHVYLGSEWNASNLEELNKNGVCHILNVTREIDNFFPGMFDYMNVRVYDDEKTDLLKHWDDTYKYINKAQAQGSKVLVHCKMGVSRSASVVIAYAMKAYNWEMKKAMEYVQYKRNCIKPNANFIAQLETYQGILDAMKNKEKLQRSKSETNLKTRECVVAVAPARSVSEGEAEEREGEVTRSARCRLNVAGSELARAGCRPKSWSPDHATANLLFTTTPGPTSVSMERLDAGAEGKSDTTADCGGMPPPAPPPLPPPPPEPRFYRNAHVRMPLINGLSYSVSQNKILQLSSSQSPEAQVASVKHRVNILESQNGCTTPQLGRKGGLDRTGLVLNLTTQFEEEPLPAGKEDIWDPGEGDKPPEAKCEIRTLGRKLRTEGDPFSSRLDRVFDREERKVQRNVPSVVTECEVSRQSSWSSYDSAVVLDCVSRQSSWGSGDTRLSTLPSRNSSWGSYDMTCYPGTVKRTKQKLEEGLLDTAKRVCPDTSPPATTADLVESKNTENSTFHVTRRCVSVDESRLGTVTDPNEIQKSVPGLVQNLKKEFEAKSVGVKTDKTTDDSVDDKTEESGKVRSLPSSPVSDRTEKPSPATSLEDLSVRKLVGKYEDRPSFPRPVVAPRKSSRDPQPPLVINQTIIVHNLKKPRPPHKSGVPTPSDVVASVVAKAASKKQQQGKTHPLARLAINKQRHNNPVYNTM